MKQLRLLFATLLLLATGCSNSKEQTYTVTRGNLLETVEATGNLASTNSVFVGCPQVEDLWEFTVSFLAQEGSEVKKGQPIIGFDTKTLMERLQTAEAQLASDRKTLEKIVLEENETLATMILDEEEKGLEVARAFRKIDVPPELQARLELEKLNYDHELAKTQKNMASAKVVLQREKLKNKIRTQETQIKSLEAEVSRLQSSIERMMVKAPKDGLVVYQESWRGEKTAVGDQVWFGASLMELPDLTQMQVDAVIDEPDAGRVAVGQPAEIRLDASPDRVFTGKIASLGRIFHQKSMDKPATVFDAKILIDKPDPALMRPGMAAKVRIVTSKAEDILLLDEAAIRFEGEKPHVLLKSGLSGAQQQPIDIGRNADGMVEVLGGLEEGQVVILPTVTPTEEKKP